MKFGRKKQLKLPEIYYTKCIAVELNITLELINI